MVTLIGYGIVLFRKIKTIIKSAGTINNNAITIADKSSNFMSEALSNIEATSGVVKGYEERIVAVLEAFQKTLEDKKSLEEVNKRLETELVEIRNYLKTSTDANVEFANELAELLGLANIPNYKKEEIGARHLESVKAIIEAEKKAEAAAILPANTEEVKEDVGEEKKD
jgi:vacuolar-type H+-ATPase subunit I/STV1